MTNTVLLEGLKDAANHTMWSDYVDRYRPLIVGYARRVGLSDADADDVAQRVLVAFAEGYRAGKYDPGKGRLRAWLFGIARTTILNHRKKPVRERQVAETAGGTGFFGRLADADQLEKLWEDEWQQAVLAQCLVEVSREVEPTTIRAFELFARQGWPASRVAAELQISENAVFGAKRRVLRRIRELLPAMRENW